MLSQTESLETLVSYFPNWESSGAIFTQMESMPWASYIDGQVLDILYLSSYSGIKIPSQIVKYFSTNHEANSQKLSAYLKAIYQKSWKRLWDTYIHEYNPLESDTLQETTTRDLDATLSQTKSETKNNTSKDELTLDTTTQDNGGETLTHGLTDTTTTDGRTVVTDNTQTTNNSTTTDSHTSDTLVKTFGFNTNPESPVPNSAESLSENNTKTIQDNTSNTGTTTTDNDTTVTSHKTGTDSTSTNNTEKRTGTETRNITNTATNSNTNSDTSTEDEMIIRTRKGNSGNHIYSEIIASEFELWKYNFFEQVFADCDKVLTLSVFNPSATLS